MSRRCLALLLVSFLAIPVTAQAGSPVFDAAGRLLRVEAAPPGPTDPRDGVDPWERWTMVSDGTSDQFEGVDLARDATGRLHAIFTGSVNFFYFLRLLYAASEDENQSWTHPNVLADTSSSNLHFLWPDFARADDEIWVLYSRYRTGFDGTEVRFVKSTDGGQTWEAPVRVEDGSPAGAYNLRVNSVSHGDTVWAAWQQEVGSGWRLRLNRSVDRGETWWPEDLAPLEGLPLHDYSQPVLARDPVSSHLYLALASAGGDIFVSRSTDGGLTWSDPVQVDDPAAVYAEEPDLVVGPDGTLYVVWSDFRTGQDTDVFFSRSTDGGQTWLQPPVEVDDEVVQGNQYEPHLALDPTGRLHVGYIFNIPYHFEVDLYYTLSDDGGLTWAPNVRANDVAGVVGADVPHTFALVGDEDGHAVLAWRDMRDYADIYAVSNHALSGLDGPTAGAGWVRCGPNPTASAWEILWARAEPRRLELVDARGRVRWRGAAEGRSWRLEDSGLRGGVYFLRWRAASGRGVVRLVKLP
jgi:hypothetical protein